MSAAYSESIGRLMTRWPAFGPKEAIVKAVRETFNDLERLRLPIDLRPLAAKRRITKIELVGDLGTDGLMVGGDDGAFTVRINRAQSPGRQRFTLAHEIAHTIFFELDGAARLMAPDCASEGDGGGVDRHVESLCDMAAAAILMPDGRVSDVLERHGVGAAGVDRVASTFNVSHYAAAVRVRNVAPLLRRGDVVRADIAVVEWRQMGSRFCANWVVGRPAMRLDESGLAVAPDDPAYELFKEENRFSRRVWISLGGAFDDYYLDGLVLNEGKERRLLTVVVFGPRPDQSILPSRQTRNSVTQLDMPL